MRIGRKDSTNMQLGFYIIRYDKSGAKITSLNGGNTDRLYTMFDWTQMGSVDYDNNKTEGTLYNTGTVGAGSWAPSFRAVGEAMNIPAGNNINSGASPAGTIRNDGGCQTTYLYTYNDIYTHDMSTTLMIYYAYSMYGSILTNKQAFQSTASSHLFNYPYLHPGMHSSLINLYDQTGYGAGTWAFKHLSIQYGRLNNVFNATIDGDNNWENGWTIGFHSYICNNATPYAVIAPNMDMQRGNGGYYFNDYWWSATDDKVIQYMAYGSLHRVISDPYYPFDLQQDLVFTGYEYDVTGISVPTDIMDNTKIFGGDIFIDYYMETRSMTATTFTYGWPGPMPIQCTISTSGTCCYSDDHYYDSDSTHRSVHYVYGLMGDIHSPDNVHTDTTQQLYITESKVNIHMRYTENNDNEDYYPAVDFDSQEINKWKPGARLFTFNQDYNSVMNIRPVVAFNHLNKVSVLSDFPTRIIRSESNNRSGLKDNFRIYKSSQYRDLPRQRGELWNLAIYDNVLLPQTERTLMKTKGKESLETGGGAGDVTAIALGDGDVFKHDPSEILYTERGYAGSTDQYSVTVSRYGHLSVDRQAGKVFLLGEKLEEISALGMREFLYKRITNWGLEPYGMPRNLDIPPAGIGIITAWDNQIERYLVTKLDKSPTAEFITAYDNGDIIFNLGSRQFEHDGDLIAWDDVEYFNDYSWTISYYPGLKFWASIHDYSPRLYFYTSDLLFSMSVDGTGSTTNAIYVHNYEGTGGTHFNVSQFYGVDYDVVFEYITNIEPESNKLYSNFYYTVDVEIPSLNEEGIRREVQETGFDVFYVYNSRQASRETPLIAPGGQYNLVQTTANTRRKQRTWYVNAFRDDVAQQVAGSGTLDVHPTSNILSSNLLSADINMNIGAINTTKVWDQRRKFTDKWFAIRLIMNSANNASATGKFLVTLHSADATYRPVYR